MNIEWNDIRLFLAVAESRTMSAAARALGVGQPTVSRRLAALEASLGYMLVHRGVEGVTLTAEGERLMEPATRMAEWAAELENTAGHGEASPRGVVRITAPPGVAFDFVAPMSTSLRNRLPQVQLEVLSTTQYLDLTRREADLALRTQPPTQRDVVEVGRLEHTNAVFAHPDYAAKVPKNATLAELDWVAWPSTHDEMPPNRHLRRLIPGFRPVFSSDDYLVQLGAVQSGVGVMVLACVRHPYSRTSHLVALPVDLGAFSRSTLHLVATRSALAVPRVRAVADHIVACFEQADGDARIGHA